MEEVTNLGDQLIAEIRRLADEHPEKTASACYFEDGELMQKPCCIVGHAMHNLGKAELLREEIEKLEWNPGWNGATFPELTVSQELSSYERRWVDNVQFAQDNGYAWGVAVEAADNNTR